MHFAPRFVLILVPALFFLAMPFFALDHAAAKSDEKICPHITVIDGSINLNGNERVLICGDGSGGEGWKTIPLAQSTLHIRTILKNQGYLKPTFEQMGDSLQIRTGPRTEISSLRVEGAKTVLHAEKKRKAVGHPLEPSKLNEVEAWAYGEIRRQGYACAQIAVEAHEWDGEVLVKANLASQKTFGKLDTGSLDGLTPDILNRYRPFSEGAIYDVRKTQLMTSRLLADGLFQSAYVTVRCIENRADLKLETSVGKPKIFRFGIGATTEEFPFLDATFRNARLDNEASSFTARAYASPREISLTFGSELYWIPGSTRSFFGPRFKAARENEESADTNTVEAGADIGRRWDSQDIRFIGRWGATMNYAKTVRGAGPDDIYYPTIEATFTMMSHDYESSIRDQYEGWTAQLYYRGQTKGLGSAADVNRYKVDLKSLWNIGAFSPPLFVFASRAEAVVVDADEISGTRNRDLVPVKDRIYLGGDSTLRGFKRQAINNGNLGFLTSLYLGFELRLIEELPFRIQPFLLFDAAKVGNQRYTLDEPIFTSEGLGVRWASPFGTLRGSAARGRVHDGDASTAGFNDQWVFFVSFGQEF